VTADTIVTVHTQRRTRPASMADSSTRTNGTSIERPAHWEAPTPGSWLWEPPYPFFRFPLTAGRSWSGEATVANAATDTRNVNRYRA
jgi:hypothetical protein